jgi:transposase
LQRTPTSPLTLLERAAAAALVADHQPVDVVAAKLQTTPKTVRRWSQVTEDEDDVEGAHRAGRKPKLSSEQMEAIVNMAIDTPKTTPREIKHELDLDCSARTVRRVLDEAGLFGRITRVAPPLKEEHIKKRLAFAEGYGNWTLQQWNTVLWSDMQR